jgi:hypothetical protein
MAIALSPFAGSGWQFLDNSGNVLAGGLLYTYAAGTTTPAVTYASSTGLVNNPNPIVLDSAGRVPNQIWLTVGTAYKFVLQNLVAVQIGAWDNVSVFSGSEPVVAWPITLDDGNVLREGGSFWTPKPNVRSTDYVRVPVDQNISALKCGYAYPISFSQAINVTKIAIGVQYNYTSTIPDNAEIKVRFFTSKNLNYNEIPDALIGGPYEFLAPRSTLYGTPDYPQVNTPGLQFKKDTLYWCVVTTEYGGINYAVNNGVEYLSDRQTSYLIDPTVNQLKAEPWAYRTSGFYSAALAEQNISGLTTLSLNPTYNTLKGDENNAMWGYTQARAKSMPFTRFFVSKP